MSCLTWVKISVMIFSSIFFFSFDFSVDLAQNSLETRFWRRSRTQKKVQFWSQIFSWSVLIKKSASSELDGDMILCVLRGPIRVGRYGARLSPDLGPTVPTTYALPPRHFKGKFMGKIALLAIFRSRDQVNEDVSINHCVFAWFFYFWLIMKCMYTLTFNKYGKFLKIEKFYLTMITSRLKFYCSFHKFKQVSWISWPS